MGDIAQTIQELAGTRNQDEVKLYQAIVNSVDITKRMCNVTTITGNATLTFDAQLMAGVSDGILIIPEIESYVFVLKSKYTIPFVVLFSDIEKIQIFSKMMELNSEQANFNLDILNIKSQLINIIGNTAFVMPVTFGAPVAFGGGFSSSTPVAGSPPSTINGQIIFNGGVNGGLVKIDDLIDKLNKIEDKINTILAWGLTVTPTLVTTPLIRTIKNDLEDSNITH